MLDFIPHADESLVGDFFFRERLSILPALPGRGTIAKPTMPIDMLVGM
jgi:hypothetical protein